MGLNFALRILGTTAFDNRNMNGLLVCKGGAKKKNIGDYIQSLAQEQFWDKIDCYCEREALDEIESKEKINLIMNGWFMWKPEKFPPSNAINPLFVSFHIVPLFKKRFFSQKTIAYLKRYEPIGARDLGTQKILESYGIKSYFSSCLTLTLGLKYKTNVKTNEILFVDPFYKVCGTREELYNWKLYFRTIINIIKYGIIVIPLLKNFEYEHSSCWKYISPKLEKFVCALSFYSTYKQKFTYRILRNCKVITHSVLQDKYPSEDKMMDLSRMLIRRYASAKLVITSRIHCALPCIAVETPVIYVDNDASESISHRSPGRLDGLKELFNLILLNENGMSFNEKLQEQVTSNKIDIDMKIKNSEDYKEYATKLEKCVREFVKKCNIDNSKD